MPIDASIPLGIKQPDQMQNLSSLLSVAKGAQDVQTGGMVLNERKAMQQVLSDPRNYLGDDGNVDFDKAVPAIMRVAPTTGTQYVQGLMTAQKQHTEAVQAVNNLTTDNRMKAGSVLAAIPPGAPADVVHKTLDALTTQYKGMAPVTNLLRAGYLHALQTGGQGAADDFLHSKAREVLPQETQQNMNTPTGVQVSDGNTTKIVNVKPQVAGLPQGATVPGTEAKQQLSPGQLENIEQDSVGNKYIVTRSAQGTILGTRPLQGAAAAPGGAPAPGPFTLPPGETKQTMDELQAQRTAAQQAANSAPVMHDINQTIAREASKGLNTGSLGQLTQKLASATGYSLAGESATDYNLLGKMLERSALTAAQSMGPHTNAGLEASIKANGSLEYTPTAIKKIAYLNDALTSGAELYRDGLEKAIGGDQKGVFAKREFDAQWAKVATPQALRLKNAVDNNNPEEISSVLKEVGGKGSAGAKKLHEQLTQLLKLSGK